MKCSADPPRASPLQDRLAAHVFAAAEQQSRLVGIGETLDLADEDDVVAAVVAEFITAFEKRRRADQYGSTGIGNDVIDIDEFVVALLGKFVGQLDLVVGQDVDDEMRAFLKGWQALRVERAAP